MIYAPVKNAVVFFTALYEFEIFTKKVHSLERHATSKGSHEHSHNMDSVLCSLTQSMKVYEGPVTVGSYQYSSKNENACVNYHNYRWLAHFFGVIHCINHTFFTLRCSVRLLSITYYRLT